MRVVIKRGKMPWIISSGKKISINQTIPIFMTKVKRPKVKSLRGKVMNFKIGFKKKLIKPKQNPQSSKVFQEPVNSTPGTI